MWRMGPRKRASTPSGGDRLLTVEGDLINRCELFDEADLDAALARFDELSRPAPRLENAASQVDERFRAYFAARDWDAMAEILADDIYARRSPAGRERRGPTRSRCRNREHAGDRRRRGHEHISRPSLRPAGSASPSVVPACRGATSGPRRSTPKRLIIVEIDADNRIAARVVFDLDDIDAAFEELDARYLAGEAAAHRAHVVGHRGGLRRVQPARTPRDDAGLGQHRPPARDPIAPGDLIAYLRAAWDLTPRHQHLHRGRASADRPRSGRHPCRERDLARGLRGRVADDRSSDVRRRPDQPLRDIRRGRPRRRTREVRRTQSAGTST